MGVINGLYRELKGGHVSQLDPVTPLSVGAAAACSAVSAAMDGFGQMSRSCLRLCPAVVSEKKTTLSSSRRILIVP